MNDREIEALYMTTAEVQEYLDVNRARVAQLRNAGLIKQLKGAMYSTASVEAYKAQRGNRKGGRYSG